MPHYLIIEPFYGGSHKQLVNIIIKQLPSSSITLLTLPAKKWHWRARTSALHFAQEIGKNSQTFDILFCSSVLNLAELLALRPELLNTKKVVYFHENQLCYPVQKEQERDFQYGYNQILTALVAEKVVFNSEFNKDSFLSGINGHFKLQPDHRPPKTLRTDIEPKCSVVYFPVHIPDFISNSTERSEEDGPIRIVWPHRWEHDKNPETFFQCLFKLKEEGLHFKVSVLGEKYSEVPKIFDEAHEKLCGEILNWGYLEDRNKYWDVLRTSDVVVSTANHEFFGVSMLEAVSCGCYPLVPQRLVYPEIFPPECIYRTDQQLFKRLKSFCKSPKLAKVNPAKELCREKFHVDKVMLQFMDLFRI